MHVLRRIAWLLLAFPVAIALVGLAVANRHPVPLMLDPFRSIESVLECDKREAGQLNCLPLRSDARIAGTVLAYELPARPAIPTPAAPLYAYMLCSVLFGMVLGGIATWLGQSKWRKRVRERTREAHRWHAEAHSLKRQLKAVEASSRGLLAPTGTEGDQRRALAS